MLLEQVKRGVVTRPFSVLLFGQDAVGKTTWAAGSPSPVFIEMEDGTTFMDVDRFPKPKSFKNVLAAVQELSEAKHDYKTLVIDSLDFLEPLVWSHTCHENSWKDIEAPGYGRGYVAALDTWRKFFSSLNALRDLRGMNIIMIAHALIKTFN